MKLLGTHKGTLLKSKTRYQGKPSCLRLAVGKRKVATAGRFLYLVKPCLWPCLCAGGRGGNELERAAEATGQGLRRTVARAARLNLTLRHFKYNRGKRARF